MTYGKIILLSAMVLAGCQTNAATNAQRVAALPMATKADIPKARAAVRALLKDPESARFSTEILKPGTVCGLVNAKNSYGGYGGDVLYLYSTVSGDTLMLQDRPGDTMDESAARSEAFK